MASCSDISEDFEVQKYSNKKLQVLYKGEGSSKIIKVTANRGNCKVYDANYYKNNFKNGNNLVSGNEVTKFCYTDTIKKISLLISKTDKYSCQDLSNKIKGDISKLELVGMYRYKPYTKEQKEEFNNIVQIMLEYNKLREQLSDMAFKYFTSNEAEYERYNDKIFIKGIRENSPNSLIYLINSWANNKDYVCEQAVCQDGAGAMYPEYRVPPFKKIIEKRGFNDEYRYPEITFEYVPLDNQEMDIINTITKIVKRYNEVSKYRDDYGKKSNLKIHSGKVLYVWEQWKDNQEAYFELESINKRQSHANGIYVKPYHTFEEYIFLNDEEIKRFKELEKQLYYDYNVELKYGNKANFDVSGCSEILEVEITTDKGNAKYSFK